MTRSKKLKKAIRARARKTGERYTAARRQVLLAREKKVGGRPPARPVAPAAARPAAAPKKPARREFSDAAAIQKTGHGFDHWFAVLDAFGAAAKGHTASARHLNEEHGVPGWHSQMVTVAYERARGLRVANQSCDGDFQVGVSKTVPVGLAEVVRAFSDARSRARWLRGADPRLVRALEAAFAGPKPREVAVRRAGYARLRYPWDGSVVEIHVYAKPNGKTSVVADNQRLAGGEDVETRRSQWKTALGGLAEYLAG
jgi:hypothetical protein